MHRKIYCSRRKNIFRRHLFILSYHENSSFLFMNKSHSGSPYTPIIEYSDKEKKAVPPLAKFSQVVSNVDHYLFFFSQKIVPGIGIVSMSGAKAVCHFSFSLPMCLLIRCQNIDLSCSLLACKFRIFRSCLIFLSSIFLSLTGSYENRQSTKIQQKSVWFKNISSV